MMARTSRIIAALFTVLFLTNCASYTPLPGTSSQKLGDIVITNHQAVIVPSNIPERRFYGDWGSGDGFASDGIELKPDHTYSKSIQTDLMPKPYTWTGHWAVQKDHVILKASHKKDRSHSLQIALYKRTVALLPDDPDSHVAGEGWALMECFFRSK